jgi:hypothetical protein
MSSDPRAVIEGKIQRRKVLYIHTEVFGPFSLAELTVTVVL